MQFPPYSVDYAVTCTGPQVSASATARVTVRGTTTASSAAFSASAYVVSQTSGLATVVINRVGNSTSKASISYSTIDDTAKAGANYTAKSGTLSWAAGDSSAKTVQITISNVAAFTGRKYFVVSLSNASGVSLGAPNTANVTINGSAASSSGSSSTSASTSSSSSSTASISSSSASSASSSATSSGMGPLAATRLLSRATFGPNLSTENSAATQTYDQWFAEQVAASPSLYLPSVPNKDVDWYPLWLTNTVTAKDQLRQRVAFALSEILVVSNNGGPLMYQSQATAAYMDLLVKGALGNYRDLLEKVTLSSAMGQYLSMFRNDRPNAATGVHADENYAREIMQLFSVGLVKLNPDGTVITDSSGKPVPTYSQTDVESLARVFTGWASKPTTSAFGESSWVYDYDYVNAMVAYENHHDTGAKTIIGGTVVPSGGTAAADLKIALDTIFSHPNLGPFIGKQLIQRLVTSNPSPAYVQRVTNVFNNNGFGVRGDLLAVTKAILTDTEATGLKTTGKLREPLIRLINLWRAFNASNAAGKAAEYSIVLNSNSLFAQAPLQSPSVFNFFRPDYRRAGELTDLNLVVPEFQTTNENTLVLTQNQLHQETYQFIDSTGKKYAGTDYDASGSINDSTVLLNTTQWEALAATPSALVDQLNLILMGGMMPDAMKVSLINYATGIPVTSPARRVVETADLIINSPQFAIQY
ncbi:MAG: DUF1800 family protein [Steroidobacteraceae bacterium]